MFFSLLLMMAISPSFALESFEVSPEGYAILDVPDFDGRRPLKTTLLVSDSTKPNMQKHPCFLKKDKFECPGLGTVPVEKVGDQRWSVAVGWFDIPLTAHVYGVIEDSNAPDQLRTENYWFWSVCVLEPGDALVCDRLASTCANNSTSAFDTSTSGYVGCWAQYAITGLFGTCNGIMCGCEREDGELVNDAVGIGEIESGGLLCNSLEEPLGTGGPPAGPGPDCNGVTWEPECF